MNNYERIKAMSLDEMAEWLANINQECRNFCFYADYETCISQDTISCKEGILMWLRQDESIEYIVNKLENTYQRSARNENRRRNKKKIR